MFSPSRPRRPTAEPVVVVYKNMHPALRPDPEAFFPNLSGPSINRELGKITYAYASPYATMRQRQGLVRISNTLRAKRSTVNARRVALEKARLEEARAAAALEAAELEAMLRAEMEAEHAAAAEKEAFNERMNNANNLVYRQLHRKTARGKKGKGKGKGKGKTRRSV